MRDHGCQPTARAWRQAGHTRGMHHVLTSDHHPTGHADTARVMRPRTDECLGLTAWGSPGELISALAAWIAHDNAQYWHATLGDTTPRPFEREDHHRRSTPFVAA
jgi:hypothetical protein